MLKLFPKSFVSLTLLLLTTINSSATTITSSVCEIIGDSVVCENEVQSYTSGYIGTYSYLWSAYGGSISGSTVSPSISVNWNYAGTGQVSVIIKDSLNNVVCTKILNVIINEGPTPKIIPSYSADCRGKDQGAGGPDKGGPSCAVACDSTWITYYTTLNPGSNYTWIVSGSSTYSISGNSIDIYWTDMGIGTVKVIETNEFGCIGEHEICVEVVGGPNAIFTSLPASGSGPIEVCLGQDVLFFNQSNAGDGSNITSYEWIFGDGFTEFYAPPDSGHTSHSYSMSGTHTVYLVVTNECGCRDTAELEIEVLDLPGPNIFCVSTVCPGTTMTYTTDASCSDYLWSTNGNGTIIGSSTDASVTVQWGASSPAILSLDIEPCSGYCPSPTSIVVPVIPSSAEIYGDSILCEYTCTTYKLDCSIPIDSIVWHVPAGFNVSGDTINVHELTICVGAATYSGTIWVEYFHNTNGATQDLSCGGEAYIDVAVRPNLNISGDVEYCENEAFSFNVPGSSGFINWTIKDNTGTTTYLSTNLPISSSLTGVWYWGPGTFIVTAEDASNQFCNKSAKRIVSVHEAPSSPSISGEDSICPNSTHNYTGIVSNSGNTVSWDVTGGLPTSGVGSSLNITWNNSGPYAVYAQELNPITGCFSKPDTLNVYSLLPLTAATITGPDTICSSGTGIYSTSSPGDNFIWSVNPSLAGSVSSGQYSNSIEIQATNYSGTAWLVLERSLCNMTNKDSIAIFITPPPSPSMTVPSSICQNETFTVSTSTSALSYTWDFGDGGSSTGDTVNYDYDSAGSYTITLTVNYGGSCPVSVSSYQLITVNPAPVVNISTGDPRLYCNPSPTISTTMVVSTSVSTSSCTWYKSPATVIGSGSSYTATTIGTYYVECTNSYGCIGTSNTITVDTISCDSGCSPQNYSLNAQQFRLGCNTDSFVYTSSNVSSQSWNFGDTYNPGSNTASGNNTLHTYTEPGIYVITLCGLVPNATSGPDCQVCVNIKDTINYVPDFFPLINCNDFSSSFTITFKNETKVFALAPTPSYAWKIDGGSILSTSTDFTTSLMPGTYDVELIINGVCSLIKTITIDSLAKADFTALDSVCEGAPILFNNTSTGTYGGPKWNFGDGSESLNPSPIRTYSSSGSYIASLTITNAFGCLDSIHKAVEVLPNNLVGNIILSGPNEFCSGDSVNLNANPSGGYPGYTFLWSNTSSSQIITAYYTGNYGVQIWDSKGCYAQVPDTVIKVNPIPNSTIIGPSELCQYAQEKYMVALPNSGYSINWYFDGSPYGTGNMLNLYAAVSGPHTIIVVASNSFGCKSADTFNIVVHPQPNVSITASGSLCAGDPNLLVASSTSTNLLSMNWNTGQTNDSIYALNAGIYVVEVTDSNGCENSAGAFIKELPKFCGLLTGCYEICDTVTMLVWHAPIGYAAYQWYFNGSPISYATSDTIHIPLYQSGSYTVELTTSSGCSAISDPIEITFISCGNCDINADLSVACGQVNAHGLQTYSVTFSVNSSLNDGANVAISSAQGQILGLSSSSVNSGSNTLTATFVDLYPTDSIVCFQIAIWDSTQRCDTTVCTRLPDCDCDKTTMDVISQQPFNCIGYDASGNPQYYGCVTVVWPGSSSTSLTLVESSSVFSPNPIPINAGTQTICFTYTDLPSVNPGSVFIHAYFYDSVTQTVCRDSFRIIYKDCPRECKFDVTGLCAHCKDKDQNGNSIYLLEMDINNPFGNFASVSIVPISAGIFDPISPNPIPPGTTTISVNFTDLPLEDTLICFRVLLTELEGSGLCFKDLCISLPDCSDVGISKLSIKQWDVQIYPNPASRLLYINLGEHQQWDNPNVIVYDLLGKPVFVSNLTEGKNKLQISGAAPGIYWVEVRSEGLVTYRKKIQIQ